MKPLLLLPLLALLMLACTHGRQSVAPASDTLLYVMAGQSNMAGRGLIEPEDTFTNPRLLAMDSLNRLVLGREPFHRNQGNLAGLDCGQRFGMTMLRYIGPPTVIGMISCGIGSSDIREWRYDSARAGVRVYSNLITRTRAALRSGQLKGVLWHQGETNAMDAASGVGYADNLVGFILKFRADVGNPRLPFFVGKLAKWCREPFKDSINAAIDVAAARAGFVYVIPTDDLPPKQDSIHFNSTAQRELGRRFAIEALKHF